LGTAAEKSSEKAEEAADTVKSGYETAKDKTVETVEATKEQSASLLEKAREGLESLKERVGSWLGNTEQKIEQTIEGEPAETIKESDLTVQNRADRVEVGRQEIITQEPVEGEPQSILEKAKEGLESAKDAVVHAATTVKDKIMGTETTPSEKQLIAEEEGTKKKTEA